MTDLELTELRQMARGPQHYSNYTLAGALHTALDRLDATEQERDTATTALAAAQAALTRAVNESGHTKFCRLYQDIGECDCWYGEAWAALASREGGQTE